MQQFRKSLKAPKDVQNPLRAFARESASLLSRPIEEQSNMFESLGLLMPISIKSLIARPSLPAFCEILVLYYDLHGIQYMGGDLHYKFGELMSLGEAKAQDAKDERMYKDDDDEAAPPPIKHWKLLWGSERDPVEHCKHDMLLIISIEWYNPGARAAFLQQDDVRKKLRQYGMPHEVDSDDDDADIFGTKGYDAEYGEFLMANNAVKCQRVLCYVQAIQNSPIAHRFGCALF